MARHSGGGFYASGTQQFVASAALGAAIGDAFRSQDDFNDCMLASGWVTDDAKSQQSTAVATYNSTPYAATPTGSANTLATEQPTSQKPTCTKEDEEIVKIAREQGYTYNSACN
jgi:hypothetical protein